MKLIALSAKIAFLAFSLFTLFLAAQGFTQSPAQQPPPQKSGTPPATLRVTARLVQVNVIAQDKDGQPVTGLTKDDFTVLDKGQPQQISSFAEQSSRLLTTAANGTPAARPANNFSNYSGGGKAPESVTVVLLDSLNTDFHDMAYARTQVVKFLHQVQPQDRIALYGLTSKIIILHDFTNDLATLVRALDKTSKWGQGQSSEGQVDLTEFDTQVASPGASGVDDQWIEAANWRSKVSDQMNKVELTQEAFIAIANHLSGVPGRKNLVWVSGSFPINMGYGSIGGRNQTAIFNGNIDKAARALSDANVAVYPVDARGLLGPGLPAGAHRPSAPPQVTLATMQSFAQGTGGLAFYNTNDIGGAIRRAIDDSRVTYILSYYPTHNQWDGSFRDIKVVAKRPGIHLRYRSGYFATPSGADNTLQQKELFADALHSPFEFTGLGLDVQADAVVAQTSAGARQFAAKVRVNPGELRFAENNGHWTDNVEVVWITLDADGKAIGSSPKMLRMNIPRHSYDKINQEGLSFSETLSVENKAVEVRLVARDTGSGAIGSVNIPLSRLFPRTNSKSSSH